MNEEKQKKTPTKNESTEYEWYYKQYKKKMNQVHDMIEKVLLKSKTTHSSAYNRLNIFVCTM